MILDLTDHPACEEIERFADDLQDACMCHVEFDRLPATVIADQIAYVTRDIVSGDGWAPGCKIDIRRRVFEALAVEVAGQEDCREER